MIHFTADTHFGHGGALGLYRRPYDNVPAMDAAMERLWNETVAQEDEVWHLGDVAVGPRATAAIGDRLARLHGRKHLVAGNNDPAIVRTWPGWASVQDYAELTLDGVKLVLCHYALRSWNGMGRGAVNLHGHSHGRLAPMTRQFDVGVDVRGFRPVTLVGLLDRGPRTRSARPQGAGVADDPP